MKITGINDAIDVYQHRNNAPSPYFVLSARVVAKKRVFMPSITIYVWMVTNNSSVDPPFAIRR